MVHQHIPIRCFNPCFVGILIEPCRGSDTSYWLCCLNPCFVGILIELVVSDIMYDGTNVLILVLLEY